ncbi:MAG: 50S ribosomal protein L24 [archaeon]|jgi:large subunit ribosomal protein L24
MSSKKPSKTRKALYEMPMHKKAKEVASHLDEKLQKEFNKRSITIRKNDVVKIMRGAFKGKEGKITEVNRKSNKIFIEKIVTKKSNGSERQVPIDASKVLVIDIDRTDRKRTAKKGKDSEKK